jgi:hypothetical protein
MLWIRNQLDQAGSGVGIHEVKMVRKGVFSGVLQSFVEA